VHSDKASAAAVQSTIDGISQGQQNIAALAAVAATGKALPADLFQGVIDAFGGAGKAIGSIAPPTDATAAKLLTQAQNEFAQVAQAAAGVQATC
jgi:hypothetical protein